MAAVSQHASVAGPPAGDGHLQGVIGREQCGLQRQVGHGAAAVLGADPALDGLAFIRVAVWGRRTREKCSRIFTLGKCDAS